MRTLRRTPAPARRPSAWAWGSDAVLALLLTGGAVAAALGRTDSTETLATPDTPSDTQGTPSAPFAPGGMTVHHHYGAAQPWQLALAVLATGPVAARRRYPLAVLWTVLSAGELFHLSPGFDATATFLACLVAAFTAALLSTRRGPAVASALAATVALVATHKANVPLSPDLAPVLLVLPVAVAACAGYAWLRRTRALKRQEEPSWMLP